MSNFLLDVSFCVKRSDGYVSDIWRVSTTRLGDFHLATGSIAGVEKYSFNKSGLCRSAHTGADGAPAALRDRAGFRWRRAATPPRGIASDRRPRMERRCCCSKWAELRLPIDRSA